MKDEFSFFRKWNDNILRFSNSYYRSYTQESSLTRGHPYKQNLQDNSPSSAPEYSILVTASKKPHPLASLH